MVIGDIVELDGTPWAACSRSLLKAAVRDLEAETGLSVVAAFEQEFLVDGAGFAPDHVMSFAALRRADPFAPRLMAALGEAGVAPDVIIAEYGRDQFEVTHAPAEAVIAADRAVAIREIAREVARNSGWRTSFAPKPDPKGVGNGVHIHFSLVDRTGAPVAYQAGAPGNLSATAGAFCAGILRHMLAITAFTAASVPSYIRLRPHNWSASYTWLGDRDREASLRICPTVALGGRDPATQFNIEYRAADATANPYLALAAIIRSGLEGLKAKLPTPPLVTGDPSTMSEGERAAKGLKRLPESLDAALQALRADATVTGWFAPILVDTYEGLKRAEMALLAGLDEAAICEKYKLAY
jgi:glutamine synthetase